MNWGKAIILVFVLFAGFIGTMVYRMSSQRVDLVREDYYQDELAYQQHIDRVRNTVRMPVGVTYRPEQQQIALAFKGTVSKGSVTFYRPADRRMDIHIPIPADQAGQRVLSTAVLAKGYWRVQGTWTDGQHDYYAEKEVFV